MLGIYARTSKDDTESSIEQQKKAGIAFASENRMEFEVYEDEGKSGYKIGDEEDLFRNRPRFSQLYKDIKDKKIDSVWIWEQSRLSRNQYQSAKIFFDFERWGIKVYVKDTLYDFKNKQEKLMRGILSAMAEYERDMIVSRTTRGLHNKINIGERSHGRFYGYQKVGVDDKGHQILEVVQSEVENIKYGYKRILEGATLRQLTLELYDSKKIKDKFEAMQLSLKWHKILLHFEYTGFALNMEGLQLFRDFKDFKIDNLSALHDTKYYTKSKHYKEKIISIDKWIEVVERLRVNRKVRLDYRTNKASKDLVTGIMVCAECKEKYYSYTSICKKRGREYNYSYYKHFKRMVDTNCKGKKSFAVNNINEIFKIFYFLNYAVYDNTKETFEETLRIMKQIRLEGEERLNAIDKDIKESEKRISKFNAAINDESDIDVIKTLAKRINVEEENLKNIKVEKSNKVVELEKLKIVQSRTEIENMYYNVKDKVNGFFNAKNMETKRDLLSRAISNCLVMETCVLIDTGFNLYVFDTRANFIFNKKQLEKLMNDEDYKFKYTEMKNQEEAVKSKNDIDWKKNKKVIDTEVNIAYICDNIIVSACSVKMDKEYIDLQFNEYKIKYDYSQLSGVMFFEEVVKTESTESTEEEIPF